MAVSASCLLPFASGLTEEYSVPENLKANKEALKVTIQMSDKTVCSAVAKYSPTESGSYSLKTPNVKKRAGVDPAEIVIDVPDSCVVYEDSVYKLFPDSKPFDDVQVRLTLGHEATHKYDINRHPIVGINSLLKSEAAKHRLSQQNLNKLYAEISNCMEARAVFNKILTYAAYLKNCKDNNRQDAYHKVRMRIKGNTSFEGLPLNVADLKDNKHIISIAYYTIVNNYGNAKIHQSGKRYVDALHEYYGKNPEQYAVETFLDYNGQFRFNTNVDYVTPDTVAQIEANCNKLDALCKEYEKEALQILQVAYAGKIKNQSTGLYEMMLDLYHRDIALMINILSCVNDAQKADAVCDDTTGALAQWYEQYNEKIMKFKLMTQAGAAETLTPEQWKHLSFGILGERAQNQAAYQRALKRFERRNYYGSQKLRELMSKIQFAIESGVR